VQFEFHERMRARILVLGTSRWALIRSKMSGYRAFLFRLKFRNHVSERNLVEGVSQSRFVSKFGLANHCLIGILSVSRSVQCAKFALGPEQRRSWILRILSVPVLLIRALS
jgi:hypothetical protein